MKLARTESGAGAGRTGLLNAGEGALPKSCRFDCVEVRESATDGDRAGASLRPFDARADGFVRGEGCLR